MSRPTFATRVRRTGLVLGGAVLGAAALLALAAGPAGAASIAPDDAAATSTAASSDADMLAPMLASPSLTLEDFDLGETRFETMPSFLPATRAPRGTRAGAASIGWRATKDPWLAAGLTLAGPAALALPALMGVWAPALASPLALAAGHFYAGDAGRGALVGLGGVGVMGAGAAAGFGLGAWLGMPVQGAMFAGGGLGLGAYSAWAAADAFRAAGAVGLVESVSVSQR